MSSEVKLSRKKSEESLFPLTPKESKLIEFIFSFNCSINIWNSQINREMKRKQLNRTDAHFKQLIIINVRVSADPIDDEAGAFALTWNFNGLFFSRNFIQRTINEKQKKIFQRF